jgi:hypothetical protein
MLLAGCDGRLPGLPGRQEPPEARISDAPPSPSLRPGGNVIVDAVA